MGTNPNLSQGQILTPGQWNALFTSKQDNLNFVPLSSAGGTLTGPLITTASIAAAAGFNVPPGVAPTLPNNGDIWEDTNYVYFQVGGTTEFVRGPTFVIVPVRGVNFNSANTDTPISIPLPTLAVGGTGYTVINVRIANGTGALNSSTFGLFTGTGGGGTALLTGVANTITTGAANTNNNAMVATPTNSNTQAYNLATLYFRVQTPQGGGSPTPADVFLQLHIN